ncbi:hypothetical protein V5799_024146 [Amblyomma americanum]|uniref:MHD domain-containing protein n=2 Tax=Ixodidae TaxID=6939 RepID=A0AAQ4EDD2_AMBAM
MIHSVFVINGSGDVFMEKHWKSVIHRSVCDYFFDVQKKAASPEDIPPVISAPHHYLINIYRNKMFFVAVTMSEVPPLFVIEFLHRVVDTFVDYFSDCTEFLIKEHYVVVYELLDEMLDNGFPLATESNILKELIKPPNILRTLANTVTGRTNLSSTLPTGQLSNVPWRRTGVKYANNEAYFDVVEEVDAIIDKSGSVISAEIQGYVDCCIKLSGMPDLSLTFVNPRLFDDVSFHPCVRFRRWEVDEVVLEVPLCKTVLNVTLTASQGKHSFDPVSKNLVWEHAGFVSRIEEASEEATEDLALDGTEEECQLEETWSQLERFVGAEPHSICIDEFVGGDDSTGTVAELTDVEIAAEVTAERPNDEAAELDPANADVAPLPTATEAVATLALVRRYCGATEGTGLSLVDRLDYVEDTVVKHAVANMKQATLLQYFQPAK